MFLQDILRSVIGILLDEQFSLGQSLVNLMKLIQIRILAMNQVINNKTSVQCFAQKKTMANFRFLLFLEISFILMLGMSLSSIAAKTDRKAYIVYMGSLLEGNIHQLLIILTYFNKLSRKVSSFFFQFLQALEISLKYSFSALIFFFYIYLS